MTPAQTSLYWRLWQAACKANAWRMQDHCLNVPEPVSDPAQAVVTAAGILARKEHRAVTLDDLRHGLHVAALARPCSSKQIQTKEFGRVMWLLKLLADPDDLDAMNHWTHPELDEQQRMEIAVRHCPEGYVREVCRRRFDGNDWRALNSQDLRALVIILSNASDGFRKPLGQRSEEPACPLFSAPK